GRQAAADDRDSVAAHLILAELYRAQLGSLGEEAFKRAANEYEELVRLDPSDGESLQTLALIYTQLRQPERAAGAWERFIALDPGRFDAHLMLGQQYLALGASDKAAAVLKKALELKPNSAQAYQKLGDV